MYISSPWQHEMYHVFVRESHKNVSLFRLDLDENITTDCLEEFSSIIVTLKTTLRVMAGGCVRYNYLRIWLHNSDWFTINDILFWSAVLDEWLMSCINLFGWSLNGKRCVPWIVHKAQWYWFRLMPVKDTSFFIIFFQPCDAVITLSFFSKILTTDTP